MLTALRHKEGHISHPTCCQKIAKESLLTRDVVLAVHKIIINKKQEALKAVEFEPRKTRNRHLRHVLVAGESTQNKTLEPGCQIDVTASAHCSTRFIW